MTPETLDEYVLAIKEAETLFREFLASVNDSPNISLTTSSSVLTD